MSKDITVRPSDCDNEIFRHKNPQSAEPTNVNTSDTMAVKPNKGSIIAKAINIEVAMIPAKLNIWRSIGNFVIVLSFMSFI